MKVAVCYSKENEEIFQHFGHTKFFKLYEIQDDKIQDSKVINAGDAGHEALADFLKTYDVSVLICGGIGQGAVNALNAAGIEIYGGNKGGADDVMTLFAQGRLEKNSAANCNHHGEHHEHPKVNVKLF